MHNKAVFLIFFLLLAVLPVPIFTVRASPGVIYVPSDDFPTIQLAVYNASLGDTIMVSAGIYEENLIVNQTVNLVGESKATTIIDGGGSDNVITLNNTTVSIRGFTIRNGEAFSGIEAPTFGNHEIFDNILVDNAYGINLLSSSGNTVIDNTLIDNRLVGINAMSANNNNVSNNHVTQSIYGIKLEGSNDNFIIGNTVSDTSYGIYLYSSNWNDVDNNNVSSKVIGILSVSSNDGDIRDNTVSESAYGIELYGGTRNNVLGNTASDNAYGIYVVLNSGNVVDGNLVSNNDWGIYFYESQSNTVTFNTASFNSYGVYLTAASTGNTIYKNNFVGNVMQAFEHGNSPATWWKKITGKNYGNHWSDYLGTDTNGDGVGDSPPESLPHWAVDEYPLMEPTMTVHDVAIVSVETSATEAYVGEVVDITIVARNEGTVNETFTVTAKYFNRVIETKTVTNLTRYDSATLVFNWDTTGVPTGFNYEISAEASTILGETDKLDNTFIDGTVEVSKEKLIGDINDDGTVNVDDLILLSQAYGSTSQSPNWNPDADLNGDNTINKTDLSLLASNYGKTA